MNSTKKEQPEVPRVSVIVPNYNYASFLDGRMDSILNQTFQDFEIIILDDASSDNSREVIEKYREHPKVSVIEYNERNTGKPCMQWQKGCELASGEFIWIAEADDLAVPEFLQKAVDALDAEEDSVLFFAGSLQNDSKGIFNQSRYDRWAQPRYRLLDGQTCYVFDGQFYIDHYLVYSNCIYNASGAVFRSSAADAKAWEYVNGCYSLGDWALWSYLAEKGKVIICREKLNMFRMHATSATKKFSKELENLRDHMRIARDNMENTGLWRRMIVVMRIRKIARKIVKERTAWKQVNKDFEAVYGKEFMLRAKLASIINMMLILTPWHISQSNDHRKKPNSH